MILIVDDFADGAEALCRLLTMSGYNCHCVSSGQEALAAVRSHPPEQPLLVVLDEMMPGMEGVEVLEALRADPRTERTPVIVYTAGFDSAKREKAITLGALAWLMKGAEVDRVLKTIITWYERLGGVKNARAPRAATRPTPPGGADA